MIGGPINFEWIENSLMNVDIQDSHRWNYLRHRLWEKEQKKKLLEIL